MWYIIGCAIFDAHLRGEEPEPRQGRFRFWPGSFVGRDSNLRVVRPPLPPLFLSSQLR